MSEFILKDFEESSQDNGVRYWDAHDFMKRLGYESWPAFQSVITKAMGSCAKLSIDPTEVFINHTYIEGDKPIKTYRLTRFACFLITMHGDSKKPQVMKARAMLAAIADQLIQQRIDETDVSRIEAREDLKIAEKLMCSTAREAGLQTEHFGIFKDAGFRGMYNCSLRQLQQDKGVRIGAVLYDFMGLEELAGNLFRVTQTSARIKKQNVMGLPALQNTAKQVGREVREFMMKDGGAAPESLPIEEDISRVRSKIKITHKAMKKFDKSKKKLVPPRQ